MKHYHRDRRLLSVMIEVNRKLYMNEKTGIKTDRFELVRADIIDVAAETGIPIQVFPAEWKKYGRAAGPIRNRAMLDYAKEETPVVAAFWDGQSRGTGNMLKQAKAAGVECHIFSYARQE